MPVLAVTDPNDERIAPYRNVPDGVLLREMGFFVAEGRLVVRQLLATSRLETRSLLLTEPAFQSLRDVLGERAVFPVYVAPQPVMNEIVGFNIHRGCLALGVRPGLVSVADLLAGGGATKPDTRTAPGPGRSHVGAAAISRVMVLEAVSNVDNVGGIFRAVAALGGHAVIVGPGCADPLYRKAIRTSMGATLRIPFASAPHWTHAVDDLRAAGFTLAALTPHSGADLLEDVAADLRTRPRVALILGAEGDGLSVAALRSADLRVRIPMAPGIDSLNVTTAAAIALYRIA